ncbi:recombinase family protein [Lusitaniella coriacea LEGE 07157]|uniref:Recombinase family protein n=1 Tax=Lusitaniella coriacea LEGE 07157 TaxID=945747 RepID=A0A8J7DV24_9CYAN|nr:recombinase family protein [Lusitaniella coriacea]MBE9115522.1 recombinase family protein [Lusitaniella coriacea LEGE 07157]
MKVFAYLWCDPFLDSPPEGDIWGIPVDRVYQDLGQRQQLQCFLSDCTKDPPDRAIVRHLEEFGDTVEEIHRVVAQLEALGIEIVATEQEYSSERENFRENWVKLLQEIQDCQRSRRLKQGHARNRIKALPPPGKACYGYRRGKDRYIIDRSTAPVVKDFFERYLLYGSLRGAVRYLEKKYGKKISVTTGRRWLVNPVYRGDLAYQNGETIANTHAPILSREEAAQIDRLLRRNSRLPPRTASAPRSLAGLVVCGECQSHTTITRTTARGKQQEYLYVRPINCPRTPKCKGIPYQQVLERAIARICEDLPRAVAQMTQPNVEGIKGSLMAEITQREEILAQIPTLQEQGILDRETAELRCYKLRAELSQLQDRIAQLPPGNLSAIAKAVSLPQFWLDLSESERRFYFREFLRQISIVWTAPNQWELTLVFIF